MMFMCKRILNCAVFQDFIAHHTDIPVKDKKGEELLSLLQGGKEDDAESVEKAIHQFVPENKEFIASLRSERLTGSTDYQEKYIDSFLQLVCSLGMMLEMDFHYSFWAEEKYFKKLFSDESIFALIHNSTIIHKNILRGLTISEEAQLSLLKERGIDLLSDRTEARLTPELILDNFDVLSSRLHSVIRHVSDRFVTGLDVISAFEERLSDELFNLLIENVRLRSEDLGGVIELLLSKENSDDGLISLSKNKHLQEDAIINNIECLDLEIVLKVNPLSFPAYETVFGYMEESDLKLDGISIHNKYLSKKEVQSLSDKAKEFLTEHATLQLVSYQTITPDMFDLGFNSTTYFFRDPGVKFSSDFSKIDNLDYIYEIQRGRLAISEKLLDCPIEDLALPNVSLADFKKRVKRSNLQPMIQILLSNKRDDEKKDFFHKIKKGDPELEEVSSIIKRRPVQENDKNKDKEEDNRLIA